VVTAQVIVVAEYAILKHLPSVEPLEVQMNVNICVHLNVTRFLADKYAENLKIIYY